MIETGSSSVLPGINKFDLHDKELESSIIEIIYLYIK